MLAEIADLEHALDVANKVDLGGAPPEVKTQALAAMSRLQNKLDGLKGHVMRMFEATQEHRAQGHATSTAWLKSNCREEGRDAARWRKVSRFLPSMPLVNEALVDGQITVAHVECLHRAQHTVGDEAFALAEEALVDVALTQRFSDFARTVEYFVVRAAPRDAEERARRQIEDRFASSSRTFGGNGVVDAQLEPVGFTIWDAELQRLCKHLLEQDRAEAQDRLGRRPLPSELGRTPRQRRADAMVLMAQRSADHADDDLSRSSFLLIVHGDAELVGRLIDFIREDMAAAAEDPDHEPDLGGFTYGPDSLHELHDGTVITVNTLLLALLTGVVRGLLYDPQGEPLRLGRSQRLFSKPQTLALQSMYRRCCHPYGCDTPPGPWMQSDHHTEWHHGGETDVLNGRLLDQIHNLWKTNHPGTAPPDPDRGQRRTPPDTGPLPPTE